MTQLAGQSQYLIFVRESVAARKTPIIVVYSKTSGVRLGKIKWYGRWRQFCFWPAPETIFNVGCMADIQEKIAELHGERRAA